MSVDLFGRSLVVEGFVRFIWARTGSRPVLSGSFVRTLGFIGFIKVRWVHSCAPRVHWVYSGSLGARPGCRWVHSGAPWWS